MSRPLLLIELVPRTCFYSNLRSQLTKREWDVIRTLCYQRAGYRCELCAGTGRSHPVECHEIWDYDDLRCIQILTGLAALCPDCHRVKHMALARHMGWDRQAELHLRRVNGWDMQTTQAHIEQAFDLFERRSQVSWVQDISWLAGYE